MTTSASARGLATITYDGLVLDVWFPATKVGDTAASTGTERLDTTPQQFAHLVGPDEERGVARIAVSTTIADLASAPTDAYDVYLRLHVLSQRLATPAEVNLSGSADLLSNVVWTNYGPCCMQDFQMIRGRLAGRGPVTVYSVDRYPRMLDYVTPEDVTVRDAGRVRLGAYLAPNTVVTENAWIDAGAGTLTATTVDERLICGQTL